MHTQNSCPPNKNSNINRNAVLQKKIIVQIKTVHGLLFQSKIDPAFLNKTLSLDTSF